VSEPDIGDANEDELHAAMDRLLVRKRRIERNLAVRHLEEGAQILYDMRSSYNEAMTCPFYAPVRGSDEGSDPYQIPRLSALPQKPVRGSKARRNTFPDFAGISMGIGSVVDFPKISSRTSPPSRWDFHVRR